MYCSDFICTYDKIKDVDIQEDVYRSQILQAFDLEQWDDTIINDKLERLFDIIKNKKEFEIIFEKLKTSKQNAFFIEMMGDDKLVLFKLLFKFELFHITHCILSSYLNDKPVSLDTLENAII